MQTFQRAVAVLGVLFTIGMLGFALKRGQFLFRSIRSGQPAPGRLARPDTRVDAEAREVVGQRKLLKWRLSGFAHVMVFYGFIVLGLTIIEAYGAMFDPSFAIPLIGHWGFIAFAEDLFAVAVLVSLVIFTGIRFSDNPGKDGRRSRFYGSHNSAAWLILFMIFNVVWTLLLYRAAQINTGDFPYPHGAAFASNALAKVLHPLGTTANEALAIIGIFLQIAVIMGFLVIVLYSKHLHIFLAPFNVFFSRRPNALGPLQPMYSGGKPIDFEDPGEDDVFGVGKSEDFTWKDNLDFATCTECGRCQSQCPAWNTEKPLSPKLLIMSLRDHQVAKAIKEIAVGIDQLL